MKISIPEGVSFEEWIIGLLKMWYPNRSTESIKDILGSFYVYQQAWPDENGNMEPVNMASITRMALTYRTIDNDK